MSNYDDKNSKQPTQNGHLPNTEQTESIRTTQNTEIEAAAAGQPTQAPAPTSEQAQTALPACVQTPPAVPTAASRAASCPASVEVTNPASAAPATVPEAPQSASLEPLVGEHDSSTRKAGGKRPLDSDTSTDTGGLPKTRRLDHTPSSETEPSNDTQHGLAQAADTLRDLVLEQQRINGELSALVQRLNAQLARTAAELDRTEAQRDEFAGELRAERTGREISRLAIEDLKKLNRKGFTDMANSHSKALREVKDNTCSRKDLSDLREATCRGVDGLTKAADQTQNQSHSALVEYIRKSIVDLHTIIEKNKQDTDESIRAIEESSSYSEEEVDVEPDLDFEQYHDENTGWGEYAREDDDQFSSNHSYSNQSIPQGQFQHGPGHNDNNYHQAIAHNGYPSSCGPGTQSHQTSVQLNSRGGPTYYGNTHGQAHVRQQDQTLPTSRGLSHTHGPDQQNQTVRNTGRSGDGRRGGLGRGNFHLPGNRGRGGSGGGANNQ